MPWHESLLTASAAAERGGGREEGERRKRSRRRREAHKQVKHYTSASALAMASHKGNTESARLQRYL